MPASPLLPFVRLPFFVRFPHHASSGSFSAKASYPVRLSELFPSASSEARSSAHRKWDRVSSGVDVPKVFEKAWKKGGFDLAFSSRALRVWELFTNSMHSQKQKQKTNKQTNKTKQTPQNPTPKPHTKQQLITSVHCHHTTEQAIYTKRLAHRPHARNQTSKQPKPST